jgi:hypothetical protein
LPDAAARAASSSCVSSGTLRIVIEGMHAFCMHPTGITTPNAGSPHPGVWIRGSRRRKMVVSLCQENRNHDRRFELRGAGARRQP